MNLFWTDEVHTTAISEVIPEDRWSCIAHLSAEDILKSAVIEEKKFKHSPRVGADNPLGPNFLCQWEGLITMVFCCKFKKNCFNLWLYKWFNKMYIAGQGQTTPGDKILMSTETSCHFSHLLQISKKENFGLILYIFFHDFIHVYSTGAGADNPLGTKF